MAISERDIEHIFERLRSGVVPERGLEAFAVGIDKQRTEIHRRLVTKVTAGFKGDVGVVPRQFLRQFVNILDLASENDEFDPMSAEGFEPIDLNEVELLIREGRTYFDEEPADIQGYAAVEF